LFLKKGGIKMNKIELIKDILKGMEYKDIRNGIWINTNDTYQEFFHHVHGDFMPDDCRYRMIHDILCNMVDDDDDEDPIDMLNSLVPIYSSDLLAWVSSNLTRISYCDQYQDEFDGSALKLTEIIIGGYFEELQEVYELINEWLDENCEEAD